MVAVTHESVKQANPLTKPKYAVKYDLQSIAPGPIGIYSANKRAAWPETGPLRT